MKLSATLFLASVGSAAAFTAPSANTAGSTLGMSDPKKTYVETQGFAQATESVSTPLEPPKPTGPITSKAIPFMKVNAALDGSLPGCVGFDPLGFADSQENLDKYREAEIKHARLAMLAAAGWPVSELFDKKLADMFGMEPLVNINNQVPSVLNGGMTNVSPFYWLGCLGAAALFEVVGMSNASKMPGYYPGNYKFDPLGLFPKEKEGQKWMRTAEIKNGRLAMVAIVGFAIQEFALHSAVIDQTPMFFKPIWETMFAQPDYFIPEEAATSINAAVEAVTSMESTSTAADIVTSMDTSSTAADIASSVPPAVVDAAPVVPPVVDVAPVTPPPVADIAPAVTADAATIAPPVNEIPAAPASNGEELAAAQKRIAELEAKLSAIGEFSR